MNTDSRTAYNLQAMKDAIGEEYEYVTEAAENFLLRAARNWSGGRVLDFCRLLSSLTGTPAVTDPDGRLQTEERTPEESAVLFFGKTRMKRGQLLNLCRVYPGWEQVQVPESTRRLLAEIESSPGDYDDAWELAELLMNITGEPEEFLCAPLTEEEEEEPC